MKRAAAHYRDGEASGFEQLPRHGAGDVAYIVEVERFNAKMGGSEDVTPVALRCTSIFRREDGN